MPRWPKSIEAQISERNPPTSFLLLQSELSPVLLHAISQRHPELSLLLVGHALPSLLNVGKGRVGDGVGGGSRSPDNGDRDRSPGGGSSDARAQERRSRCAHHLDGYFRMCVVVVGSSEGEKGNGEWEWRLVQLRLLTT